MNNFSSNSKLTQFKYFNFKLNKWKHLTQYMNMFSYCNKLNPNGINKVRIFNNGRYIVLKLNFKH